jgi:NaMN:DMB phosphoribosyltransferase
VDDGTDLLLVSLTPEDRDDVGWQVLAAHLLDLDPVEAIGWPSADRSTDREWVERVAAIRDGLRRVRGIRNQPERLLTELDSPALAAGTGLLLQAAARRTPALLDGPGAAACALLAHRVARASRSWWQAADAGHRELHDRVLTDLRLTPLTRFGLPAEDGTAARIGLHLLETALSRAIESADEDLDDEADRPPTDA